VQSNNGILGLHAIRQGDKVTIVTSDGETIDKPPYLTELVSRYGKYLCIVYDLDLFAACLFKAIGITKEQGQVLHKRERLKIPPWEITYFTGRFLSFDYGAGAGHHYINFANMNQAGYGEAHYDKLKQTIPDAIKKAKEAKAVGEDVRHILASLGLDYSSLISPVTPFLRKFTLKWPTQSDMPVEVGAMAADAVKGHRFETYAIGKWRQAYDWDINAAYLAILAKLPDLRRGEWIHVKGNEMPPEATLGVARGILATDAPFHPFSIDIGESSYTPTGSFPITLTLYHINFLRKWKQGSFVQTEGFYWIPKGDQCQPYRGAMMFLWKQRQEATGRKRLIIQRLYSALVGKQIEGLTTGHFGLMFNPIIPAHVEAASNLQVADACLEHGITPIAVTGDGFVSDKPIDLSLSTEMGGWKLNRQGECVSIGSNVIMFKDGDSKEDYEDLMRQIADNPKLTTYSKTWYSPVTLPVALQGDWDSLGEIRQLDRSFDISSESKRIYPKRPTTGSALISGKHYTSLPWAYDQLLLPKNP
jgi:hypothetical protein